MQNYRRTYGLTYFLFEMLSKLLINQLEHRVKPHNIVLTQLKYPIKYLQFKQDCSQDFSPGGGGMPNRF